MLRWAWVGVSDWFPQTVVANSCMQGCVACFWFQIIRYIVAILNENKWTEQKWNSIAGGFWGPDYTQWISVFGWNKRNLISITIWLLILNSLEFQLWLYPLNKSFVWSFKNSFRFARNFFFVRKTYLFQEFFMKCFDIFLKGKLKHDSEMQTDKPIPRKNHPTYGN